MDDHRMFRASQLLKLYKFEMINVFKMQCIKLKYRLFTQMTNIIVQKRVPNSRNYEIWNILLEFLRNITFYIKPNPKYL